LMDRFGGSMSTFSRGVLRAALGTSRQERETAVVSYSAGLIRKSLRLLAGLALLLCLVAAGAKAQDAASITGTVVDKTGAPVFDASVKLLDTRTGAVYESRTGSFGAYLFARVPAGQGYTLTVSKESFKTVNISKLVLAVTETAIYDVTLELGNVSQTIQVTANSGAALNTTDATIGNDIDTRRVAELPSLFRTNAAALLQLAPGVVGHDDGGLEQDSQLGSVTGSRADQGNITL